MIDQATTIGLLPTTPMLISYDAPTRPQYWQLHPKNGDRHLLHRLLLAEVEALRHRRRVRQGLQGEVQGSPGLSALNGFGDVVDPRAGDQGGQQHRSEGADQGARDRHVQELARRAGDLPAADGVYWHNWLPPVLILQLQQAEAGLEGRRA